MGPVNNSNDMVCVDISVQQVFKSHGFSSLLFYNSLKQQQQQKQQINKMATNILD